MLEVQDISVRFGSVEAVRRVSFGVDRGEVVALFGANGAGKSTLLSAIMGLVPAVEGSVALDGQRLDGVPANQRARRGIGHCPERRGTFPCLSVRDNLRLGGYARPEAESKVRESQMYDLFPLLGERKKQVASTLSGGERQMLSLARALMMHPRLLLLDEPSQGLAPQVATELYAIMARMVSEDGLAMVLVEQRQDLLRIPLTRSHQMHAGELTAVPA